MRVTKVTPEIIERVPYFDISLYVDGMKYEIGEEIQALHKELLKFVLAADSTCEYIILINLLTGDIHFQQGEDFSVDLTDDLREMLEIASSNSFAVLHNHPNNSLFSFKDMRSFVGYDSIYLLTAIGNNGDIYALTKEDGFPIEDEDREAFLLRYNRASKKGVLRSFFKDIGKFGLGFYEVKQVQ